MAKEGIQHKDLLGNEITDASKLAVSWKNSLYICSIIKIHPKMMRCKPLVRSTWMADGILVYPNQCVVVDGPDVMAYVLRGGA